jgi:hypothetical protein
MTEYSGDIVSRLRRWAIATDAVPASDLMDEAAREIEMLRSGSPKHHAGDIVNQLRDRAYAFKATDRLSEQAADEIERLRQFDRSEPIEPADATPAAHATPCEGSVRRNCSVESRETVQQEPVAWAILHNDHQYVSLLREHAEANNVYVDAAVVPLFRSPTLTDEEREAIYRAEARLRTAYVPDDQTAATLRKLLERTI